MSAATPSWEDPDYRPPSIADGTVAPGLIEELGHLVGEYGLAGVASVVAELVGAGPSWEAMGGRVGTASVQWNDDAGYLAGFVEHDDEAGWVVSAGWDDGATAWLLYEEFETEDDANRFVLGLQVLRCGTCWGTGQVWEMAHSNRGPDWEPCPECGCAGEATPPAESPIPDLMDRLQESLAEAREARRNHPRPAGEATP